MNKNKKKLVIFIVLLSIVTLGYTGFVTAQTFSLSQGNGGNELIQKHKLVSLRKNATDLQKKHYESLVGALNETEQDEEKIASLVVENYIADYYTWTNKLRMNDVGGLQYIYEPMRNWVYDQSLDRFYNDMRYYIEQESVKDSLEVESTQINSVKKTEFLMDDVLRDAYEVEAVWQYKDSKVLDRSKFNTKATFILVKSNDGLFRIVEVNDGSIKANSNVES